MNKPHDSCVFIDKVAFSWFNKSIYEDISLDVPKGKIVAIMGPSGTGKTTLLRLIGGQLYPQKGQVLFNGIDMHKLKRKELFKVREDMGLLFQSGALFSNMSVFENVAFPYIEHTNMSRSMIKHLVNIKLEIVGLRGARHLMPNQLSGGMSRRVAIARALALDPKLIMFDEPFVGQDPISVGILMRLMKELNKALGMTIIVVSHDVDECFHIADYLYIISQGRILGQGTVEEIKESTNERVKQFIQGRPDGKIPFHYVGSSFYEDMLSVS